MPAWTAITAADIEARIPANALAALRERYNLDGTDPLAAQIADVVARVRGAVASCSSYQVDADAATVPPELRDDAAWLVCAGIMLRVPDVMPMTEDHRARVTLAEKRLEKVASCDLAISTPSTAVDSATQSTGGVQLVSHTDRRNTRARLNGLL